MFVPIANTPRAYAWGSVRGISDLLGSEPSGGPEAELWLGTHEGSPSRLVGREGDLRDVVDQPLPFLLKVLAAEEPLSLQAHPTRRQAQEGFDRENRLGIPLTAAERNYKDANHKPELIVAESEVFQALCGFRPVEEVLASLRALPQGDGVAELARSVASEPPGDLVAGLLQGGERTRALVDEVVEAASDAVGREFETVRLLAHHHPRDPGIVISLLLHTVHLRRGEALYLPAGNIHAYLRGVGIELMSASDNVLRGGLTGKHVDVPELVRVLDATPGPAPLLRPESSGGMRVFRPDVPDFVLMEATPAGFPVRCPLPGPAIALCVEGSLAVRGASSAGVLERGGAAYISADERELRIEGEGRMYVASGGSSRAS